MDVLLETNLNDIPLSRKGKVRDVYEIDDMLLMITTDRISAFDVVLPNGIPDKGKVLTQLSSYWFDKTRSLVPNHVISSRIADYPPRLAPFHDQLEGRSMLVRRLSPVPFECVVRGYLYGSGWKEYREQGSVCGIELPPGMVLAQKLSQPLFTPATKAESGHDVNISERAMARELGSELAERLKQLSLQIYELGRNEAETKGIIIADTKMEFGIDDEDGSLYVIDELLTPDSSRFWPKDEYQPGRDQPSYDKQFVREYLETLDWDKTPPGPELPEEVVLGTRDRFHQAFSSLTGEAWPRS